MKPTSLRQIYGQRYYDAQLLKVADFERERDFHVERNALETRLTFAPGILLGFEVRARQGGRVLIGPGVAIDAEGRQVLLRDRARAERGSAASTSTGVLLDLSGREFHGKRLAIAVRWGRGTDPEDEARTVSEPVLAVRELAAEDDPPATAEIEIARVEITATPQPASPPGPAGSPPRQPPPSVVKASIIRSTRVPATLRPERLPALSASQMPSVDAGRITGELKPEQIPALPASKIVGPLEVEQLPDLPVSKLDGTLPIERLPGIPVSKLEGSLPLERLPEVPVSKITGELGVDRIRGLDDRLASWAMHHGGGAGTLFYADRPVLERAGSVTLFWRVTESDDVTIFYHDLEDARTLSSSAGELVGISHTVEVLRTTHFTLQSHKDGVVTAHAQLTVAVEPTVEAITGFMAEQGIRGDSVTEETVLTEVVVPVIAAFELQALGPHTVRLLAHAFRQAGIGMAATFRGLPEYFEALWLPTAYTPIVLEAYGLG